MKNLKRLGVSFTLMFVLAVATFAGETSAPPCAPPEPGQTNTPPCAEAPTTTAHSVTQGETNAPPASNAGDTYSVAEVAIDLLQSVLLLF
ncbi:MAG: hypothetical protein QOG23_1356 [Blastocatellia bacterium]|jgi:hypothetical protein|nr:hypothetical protein [Blastocatellia bacterium]